MRKVHGWRRAARWVFGILASVLGLVMVTLLAVFIVFQTGWGHSFLRGQIESRMNAMFVGGAKIGSVEGNPLSELTLKDVVINGPDKQPAISAKSIKVKLPLIPLISHQLRVDKIIANDLDVRIKRDRNGELNLANLTKPGPKSTWNIVLPNLEVHRGHVGIDTGKQVIDVDNLEVYVDAKMPFAGPLKAAVTIDAKWRQQAAPIAIGAVVYGDHEVFAIHNAVGGIGKVHFAVAGARIPKGHFAKPYAGTIVVHAPAEEVHRLLPQVTLPDDVSIAINALPDGRLTQLAINGRIGPGIFRGFARGDVQAKFVSGVILADNLQLDKLTQGKLIGTGGALASFDLDGNGKGELPTAKAVITAWAKTQHDPNTYAVIAVESKGDRAVAEVGVSSAGGIRAGVGAAIRKQGKVIDLERGDLVASTVDVRRASKGKSPVSGVLSAKLHAEGKLAPKANLAINGFANGKRLRGAGARVDTMRFRIAAHDVPSNPIGSGRVELYGLTRGQLDLAKLTVAAGNRPDGKLQVSLRSQPKSAAWLVDLDALVAGLGDPTMTVDLQRHFIRLSGGSTWRGNTGRITIGPRKVELRGLRSVSGDGHIDLAGSYIRAGRDKGDLAARVDASLELKDLSKAYKGHVDAHVDVKRDGKELTGLVDAKATGMSLNPKSPMLLDAAAKIQAHPDQVLVDAEVRTAKAGAAKVAIDVKAPKDITDVRAWRKLHRGAIRSAVVGLKDIDLGQVTKATGTTPLQGHVNGEIKLTATEIGGLITLRGLKNQRTQGIGTVNADLKFEQPSLQGLRTTLTAQLVPTPAAIAAKDVTQNGSARLLADATFVAPQHLFDPTAWQQLGPKAFRGATIRAERLAFQPGTLELLGIVSPLRGELDAGAEIEEGMRAVRFNVNLHQLRGGVLAQPIAANVAGVIDHDSTRVVAYVRGQGVTLLNVNSKAPITLEELRRNPQAAKNAPITATARIDNVPATSLMKTLGTSQITGGILDGTIKVAGTALKPTVDAKLVAHDVTVPSGGMHAVQNIKVLTFNGTWDGAKGNVAIDADETGGGKLKIRAAGSPDELAAVTASLQASKLDVAPLVAFMPGPAGGLGGRMDATLSVKGADPRTAEILGTLRMTNSRLPIAPAVGTLFKGDLRLNFINKTLQLNLVGKLGRGDIKVVANAPLEGVTPKSGKAQITLHKVQLIGTTEPIITGVITADLARVGEVWRSNVMVAGLKVKVPKEKGKKLEPVGKPVDLVYGGEKIHHDVHHGQDVPGGIVKDKDQTPVDFKPSSQVEGAPPRRKLPTDPVAVADVTIKNVFVESEEVRGLLHGKLTLTLADNNEVGVVGHVSLSRGVLDLFNRRYQVDKAVLHFDGSPDPRLEVRITHDFPEVTTITEVRGRMSKPQLLLSSSPPRYSQSELLGFLLGGEPGGDPENAPSASERVAGAGASFVGNKIGGYVKKALPVDIDVLRYESASATSSAAVTVGTWITDTLFLAYRHHLEARPDENTGEGEVEYWLKRRLVIEGVVGDRGVNGADLVWRRRW